MLRRKSWDRRIFQRHPGVQRIANSKLPGIHEADDVTRKRLLDRFALAAEESIRPRRTNLVPLSLVDDHHVFLEQAGANAQEGDAVAMPLVHVRLNLEDEAAEVHGFG